MNISEKIYTRRKELGLTLQEISDYVGVGKTTVHGWESGRTKSLKIKDLHKLARILKVDVGSLSFDDEELREVDYDKQNIVTSNIMVTDGKQPLNDLETSIINEVRKMNMMQQIELYYELRKKNEEMDK